MREIERPARGPAGRCVAALLDSLAGHASFLSAIYAPAGYGPQQLLYQLRRHPVLIPAPVDWIHSVLSPVHIGAVAIAGVQGEWDVGPQPGVLTVPPVTVQAVAHAHVWQVRDVVAHQ
jgi:hypothetical protein